MAAEQATRICTILAWARRHKVTLRYFSTDAIEPTTPPPWEYVGHRGVATIVNALEVRFKRTPIIDPAAVLFRVVGLTAKNRRALVTFLWEAPSRRHRIRGALIWSDSSGETCLKGAVCDNDLTPWDHVAMMTAPHHGSDAEGHEEIWAVYHRETQRLGFRIPVIVNGGQTHQRLAPSVQNLGADLTACTYCKHHPTAHHQTVTAHLVESLLTIEPRCADVVAVIRQDNPPPP